MSGPPAGALVAKQRVDVATRGRAGNGVAIRSPERLDGRAAAHARGDDQRAPRRRAARQPPGPDAGPRLRAGRGPAVPTGRRRPPDRLERDRPHPADPHPRADRRPRPRGVARRRRLGGDAVRHRAQPEGADRVGRRRGGRLPHRPQPEPARRDPRRRARTPHRPAARRANAGPGDPVEDRRATAVGGTRAGPTSPARSTGSVRCRSGAASSP